MVSQRTRIWFPFAALSVLYVLQTAEGRGMFGGGGGMMEGDRRLTKTEDALTGKTWMLERTIKESGEQDGLAKSASKQLNGCTTLYFTKDNGEIRSRKFVVHFSTGEVGYWRMGRGGTGGILGNISSKLAPKKKAEEVSSEKRVHKVAKSYEDAVLANPATEILEIEVLSNQPKLAKRRYRRSTTAQPATPEPTGPVLVYQIPIAYGRVQKSSMVNDVPGVVRLLSGEVSKNDIGDYCYSEHSDIMEGKGLTVGSVNLKLKHGRGLVDPLWARGRQWFYNGRRKGNL